MQNPTKLAIYAAVIAVLLSIAAYFMANVPLPPWSHYVSALSVVAFALPSFWAVRRWLGWKNGATLIAVLGAYAFLVETTAIITGFPYGHFGYSEHLGYRVFGYTPWTLAFAWTPLMLGAYAVARRIIATRLVRIVAAALILTTFDLVLDPGAVYLGFWKYEGGGWFYEVPWTNFAGWLLSSFVGAAIIDTIVESFKPLLPTPAQLWMSATAIVFLWSAFAFFAGMEEPALIGVLSVVFMAALYRRFYYAFDEMIVLVDGDDNPVRTERKSVAHNGYTKLHRAFSVFLFNSRGELLLQQRASSKKTWPGVWSNSCCGHVMLHEEVISAAKRRLKYELGLSGISLSVALPDFRYRAEKDGIVENEICPVLIGFTERSPRPNPDEVADTKWVDWDELVRSVESGESELSPWAADEIRLLAESDILKNSLAADRV
jgi:isopentenyl-diphosphate Delta-isomerase